MTKQAWSKKDLLQGQNKREIPTTQDGPTRTLLIAVDDSCHLPSQLCVLLPVVSFCLEGPDSCLEAKPMRIHRSNSDSNLYCKTMVNEDSGQTPIITERRPTNQSRYLDQERLAFVQSYLEKAGDARTMTTEISDSGVPGTHGTPSEFGLEDTSVCEFLNKPLRWVLIIFSTYQKALSKFLSHHTNYGWKSASVL